MKILFIVRATWLKGFGGDSLQIASTAKYLRKEGVEVDIRLCNEKIHYDSYDLIHIFNLIRPADTLQHVMKCGKPYLISTIFLDYGAFESKHREGILKWTNKYLSKSSTEYLKTIARSVKNGEKINSLQYCWLGHKRSIIKLVKGASLLLPNSHSEYTRLEEYTGLQKSYKVIYNGIDEEQHTYLKENEIPKENDLVICVARIEGNKNQLNLIRALNNSEFRVKIIGKPAPNHQKYFEACKKAAASNVEFTGFISLDGLIKNYQKAKVHILPSFSETCGLSSLEAAHHKCSLVITSGGDTTEYFQNEAFYCEPDNTTSIIDAVRKAVRSSYSKELYHKTHSIYTWKEAARETLKAYNKVLEQSTETSNKLNSINLAQYDGR